ncbi:MAG: glycosyltransferase [Caulobacterales bacterium]|nr:glycosyltransferase [Caulobacterales bacterium]
MDGADRPAPNMTGPKASLSARSSWSWTLVALLFVALTTALIAQRSAWWGPTWSLLTSGFWVGFVAVVVFKTICCLSPPAHPRSISPRPRRWPHYTLVAALKDEADIVPQLIRRLARIDYPARHLTGFLVVEPDDPTTLAAILATPRPPWLVPLVAPPGTPQTKPRALNVALQRAPAGLLTVYDAEDEPHPEQLKEAAVAFASGGPDLACLQAPLQIRTLGRAATWLERQFAHEYAALFEVILPAMVRMGLPIPLGGTSNHFRVDILKEVGGWDPWNVTEDADLGFRLTRRGYRIGTLSRPTRESPPSDFRAWLPQRTRWLKGFMQTISVNLRHPRDLGWGGVAALMLTLVAAVASATLQGPVLAWVLANLLIHGLNGTSPSFTVPHLALLVTGWLVAIWTVQIGVGRTASRLSLLDALTSPLYWSLTSLAQVHAVWRLVFQPFHWDKTPHLPDLQEHTGSRRVLRNRASLPTLRVSPNQTTGPWKFSISKRTPTSAPASSSVIAPKTSRECAPPDA